MQNNIEEVICKNSNIQFKVIGGDTDAVWFSKSDESSFNKEEISDILYKLNQIFPEYIKFDSDGYFQRFVILKAKNYIMYDGEKLKLKGSSLKSSTLEPALKEMLKEMIDAIVFSKQHELQAIYHKYIKEASDIKDMKRWSSKKTISTKTVSSERANETRIIEALERNSKPVIEGDKWYVYFKTPKILELCEAFNGVYHVDTYLKKLYKTTERFDTILNMEELFLDFSLKRNKKLIDGILNAKSD